MCLGAHVWLFATPWTVALRLLCLWGFSRQKYWSGLPCPPLGDLPHPGIKPRSSALKVNSLHLNYQGHPRILEWVAYPFSRGSSWPRSQTEVSYIADGFFACWVPGKPLFFSLYQLYGQLNYNSGQWDKVIKTMDSRTRLLCNREQIT